MRSSQNASSSSSSKPSAPEGEPQWSGLCQCPADHIPDIFQLHSVVCAACVVLRGRGCAGRPEMLQVGRSLRAERRKLLAAIKPHSTVDGKGITNGGWKKR